MSETNPTQTLGSLWEIKSKANVKVIRPDGDELVFAPDHDGVVVVALDTAGEWSAEVDGKPVATAKVG